MFSSTRLFSCFLLLLTCHCTSGFAQEQSPECTPPIATDGRVEVDEIRISRVRASGASREADLTNMRISLWVDTKDPNARDCVVRIVELEPIVDDTGKVLSTEDRRRNMLPLQKEQRAREFKTFRGRRGPVVSLLLDAPLRRASRIKLLKGRLEITPARTEKIIVDNLPSLVGKRVKHDLLKKLTIVPRIEIVDDTTEVTLDITGQTDRLIAWTVAQDGKPLNWANQSESARADPVRTVGHGYPRFQPNKKTSLLLAVATVGMKEIIDFEFSDLELP